MIKLPPVRDSLGPSYRYDGEHDGIEIYFSNKPAPDVLDKLSSNDWKWHRAKKCWYAKRSPQNIKMAEDICAGQGNTPEQERQKLILAAREQLGFGWLRQFESYSTEQLTELMDTEERMSLYSELATDYLSWYNIKVSFNDDIEFLRKLVPPSTDFEHYHYHIMGKVKHEAERLFDTAYWCQAGLNEAKMARKYFADINSPNGLKESTFWENFQLYGGNLQPIDIARRMGFSFANEDLTKQYNPRIERLALTQIQEMQTPYYDFDMTENDFSRALSVLYYKNDSWKQICREYCLRHSKAPDKFEKKSENGNLFTEEEIEKLLKIGFTQQEIKKMQDKLNA